MIVQIPKVGKVQFPDTMQQHEVEKAAGELHDKALMNGVMAFVGQDPALGQLPQSEVHKQLGTIAALLEKHPRLARAVDAGMATVSSQDAQQPAAQGTQESESTQPQASGTLESPSTQ